ncbi:MAG TPA: thiamine diphosphokinase [Candidatus Limnocylindrales bacterium]|nr:thiamine diphosphokinase [Candidatus Limnocylindrales bacterium]
MARPQDRPVHALVVAAGDVPERSALDAAWPGWSDDVGLVVAADGGAARVARLGFTPHVVVGDGDSLAPAEIERLRAAGVELVLVPAAKDESDTELAVLHALDRGARRVSLVGATGGPRLDHTLANVALLAHPRLSGVPAVILDAQARIRLVRAPGPDDRPVRLPLPGPAGGIVSLLPLEPRVDGVTTEGLLFPLRNEPLALGPARGLSNVRLAGDAAVVVAHGLLLVVETPATLRP